MTPKTRKYDSGYEKRKKKKREEELIESQRGALNKFFTKEPQVSTDPTDLNLNIPVDATDLNLNMHVDANVFIDGSLPAGANNNVDDVSIENNIEFDDTLAGNDTNEQTLLSKTFHFPDIYDPRTWDGLSKLIDLLVERGPKRDNTITKGPKDKFCRRFTSNLYTRVLSNGENHVGIRLKEHETSIDHDVSINLYFHCNLFIFVIDIAVTCNPNLREEHVVQPEAESYLDHSGNMFSFIEASILWYGLISLQGG
ncbi:putative transcription factor and/or regulators TTF-type(Zn) family [Heracleum sosnowskyi]|uniref:Transcription factor and/or regulators TTF-type(Zn) family n=1 Tax=Heracleum sosnowskyi TaxID=360622 RepID=A0AAD8HPG5_9APIA|nr:putative transcription factor and/or regulators TTF-type(Zn) family [Heracleum sosnowskyi]